jgi:hypothetical protein
MGTPKPTSTAHQHAVDALATETPKFTYPSGEFAGEQYVHSRTAMGVGGGRHCPHLRATPRTPCAEPDRSNPLRIRIETGRKRRLSPRGRRFGVLAAAAGIFLAAAPTAYAASSQTATVTVTAPTTTKSLTITPSGTSTTFAACNDPSQGNIATLTIPNGQCSLGTWSTSGFVTVANGPVAALISIQGGPAQAKNGTGNWQLPPATPIPVDSTYQPSVGADTYGEVVLNSASQNGNSLGTLPVCDFAFGQGECANAQPGAHANEIPIVVAPKSSSSTATSFDITTTWTVS